METDPWMIEVPISVLAVACYGDGMEADDAWRTLRELVDAAEPPPKAPQSIEPGTAPAGLTIVTFLAGAEVERLPITMKALPAEQPEESARRHRSEMKAGLIDVVGVYDGDDGRLIAETDLVGVRHFDDRLAR